MNYLHVCTKECFCPVCGKHKVAGPTTPIPDGYQMTVECPDHHWKADSWKVEYGTFVK
jgi:hypothetical protein